MDYLFYTCLLLFATDVSGVITNAPSNAVAEVGKQAIFNCSSDTTLQNWILTTKREDLGTSAAQNIAINCIVQPGFTTHYEVDRPGGNSNICNLIVKDTTMQQAGIYTCSDTSAGPSAILTVTEKLLNATYNTTAGVVVEKDNVIIECVLNYNGTMSPAPTLRPYFYWTDFNGQNVSSSYNSTTDNTAVSQLKVTADRQNITSYTCHVYFQLMPPPNTDYANNTPTVSNSATSPNITVFYEPSKPIISHGINNFTASDLSVCTLTTLTCTSTANPPPIYTWKDVTSGKVIGIYGSIFEWAEDNRTYECTATNTIKSANKSSSATYTVGNSSALPCASVKSTDIRICSDDGSCDDGATPRSCSNASHIYLTCNVSNVYPSPTQFQWKDGSGNILINSSEYNATISGGYSVFVYNEINQQINTPAVIYVTVTDCCENWKLTVSVIIPWIGVCLIATIIFIVCYASLTTPFRAKMLSRFSWLEYMLPCVNSPKVEPQRGDESAESSAPIWKILGFVILLIFVSVTCGILFFPILITIAYCCPTVGEDNDGQMMNRSPKKGKPIYFIPLFLLMWFGVVALMFPLTFVLVYFITCEQMTFRYVVTR